MSRGDAPAPLRVIYEDARLLAADKPSGQPVIPARGAASEPLVAQASARIGGKAFVVHRIDRDTSGLVLFAKDAETHRTLCALFEERRVEKTYLALVRGQAPEAGFVDLPLREFGSGRTAPDLAAGKPSATVYRRLELLRAAALLCVRPLTGRRHQIRAHLCAAGHPILGDPLYGPRQAGKRVGRLMLHAWRLAIPIAGKALELQADAPPDFQEALAALR